MRFFKATKRRELGAVTVEVGFSCVVLMLFISATFDFAHMHYSRSSLQHAVSQAARFAITGNTVADPSNDGGRLSRDASIRHLIRTMSGIDDLTRDDIQVYVVQSDGSLAAGAGGPGDVIMVRASYRIGLITPGLAKLFPEGEYAFTCSARFRNEEFTRASLDGALVTRGVG